MVLQRNRSKRFRIFFGTAAGLLFREEHGIIAAFDEGGAAQMSDRKKSKKENTKRVIALVIAGIMVFSVLAAALLSQIW